ncbi:MAG: phosphotransferase, partial [Candidatus Limnocylindrales bacterium]
ESAGFAGAPRVLGVEDGVEVLSYLPGEVPADPGWQPGRGLALSSNARSERSLVAAARLLRELHEAARGYIPTANEFRFHPYPLRPGEIMSHGDLGPWNTVYRDGLPVALIDWDACRPIDPLVDIALAAWAFVPLEPDLRLAEVGFDPSPDLGERLRVFIDSYGGIDRTRVIAALQDAMLVQADRVRYWGLGPVDTATALEFHAAELRWLGDNADRLERALR